MANLTLSVDENTIERARAAASAMGVSLNQLVREHIERAAASKGKLNGWKFNRDEANSRG